MGVNDSAGRLPYAQIPARANLALKRRCIATRSTFPTGATQTLAVQTRTFLWGCKTTSEANDLQVCYQNPSDGVRMTIKGSMVIGGVIFPLYFNGQRTAVLDPNGALISDPVPRRVTPLGDIIVRTYADAGSGNVLKANVLQGDGTSTIYGGTWTGASTGIADYVDSVSPPATETTSYFGVGPNCIIGRSQSPCLIAYGDSITEGGYITNLRSWVAESFGRSSTYVSNVGAEANILQLSKGGTRATDFHTFFHKNRFLEFGDVAIVAMGANDVNTALTFAQIQAALLSMWNSFANRLMPIWACTITPRSTSTDSWATTGNQTAQYLSTINSLNDWIRTLPAPITGVIDLSDAMSTSRNSGIWKAGYTSDGLHPNLTAVPSLWTLMPADLLTKNL